MLPIKHILIVWCVLGVVAARRGPGKSSESSQSIGSSESWESEESRRFQDTVDVGSSDLCHRGCPRILDPICAVDENDSTSVKYFHNQCLMEYDGCSKEKSKLLFLLLNN